MSAGQQIGLAREYLRSARQRDINYMPPWGCSGTPAGSPRLAQVRRVLAFRGLGGSRATASPLT
jgi:hypothetical protein